jgi:sugar-specific transcriptional regulator TrmB
LYVIIIGDIARRGSELLLRNDYVDFLIELGFTQTQAKLYLALLKMETADGRTLSNYTNLPRPEVYRTLDELQRKGLVEKEIAQPLRFRATPIQHGLQMLMTQKFDECKEIQEKTEAFIREIEISQDIIEAQEHKIVMIDRKERIIQKVREQHDNAQQSVNIRTTMQRLLQFLHSSLENLVRALDRGVHYRVLVQEAVHENSLNEDIRALLSKPSFELKVTKDTCSVTAVVFDGREVNFALYPSKSISETPIIWTNHPSLIRLFQEHFENVWKHSHKFKMQNTNRKNEKRKT